MQVQQYMHVQPCLSMYADFSGEQVVQRHMSRLGRELLYHRIEAASGTSDRKALDLVLQEYGAPILCLTPGSHISIPAVSCGLVICSFELRRCPAATA